MTPASVPSRILVKICGLTQLEDCLLAARSGADWIGFVLHPPSPRYIKPMRVRTIVQALGDQIEQPPLTVGVFVDREPLFVQETLVECGIDRAQLHGDEDPSQFAALGQKILTTYRLSSAADLERIVPPLDDFFLVDSHVPGRYGGTGCPVDWELASRAARMGQMILAGGLRPETVGEALQTVRPHGVDVSSGVESSPGRKNPEKLRTFIEEVRRWESRTPKDTSGPTGVVSSPKP